MVRKRLVGWVDIFLLGIIVLNILDFFEIIGPDLDFLKKILSWWLLGALLYHASPSRVFFGERHKRFDIWVIISYFLMIVNKLTHYASEMVTSMETTGKSAIFEGVFQSLAINSGTYTAWGLYLGVFGLVILGMLGVSWPFKKRSIMGILHEEGEPGKKTGERYLMTLLVLFGFFVFVFNLMMEWLAIAVDATIILIAILFYSVLIIRHELTVHRFLEKVGNAGSGFYEWFIGHFRYKETFLLGIVGLLVLHILTDVGNFLIPYLTGLKDILYLGALNASYVQAWQTLTANMRLFPGFLGNLQVIIIYIGNVAGFLFLFFAPAFIWRSMYHKQHPTLPPWLRVTAFASMPAVVLAPLFSISGIGSGGVRGAQVQVASMAGSIPLWGIIIAMAILGGCAALPSARRLTDRLWVGAATVFFGKYISLFFFDLVAYFQETIAALITSGRFILGLILFIFLMLDVLLYVGGFLLFLYELVHRTSRR